MALILADVKIPLAAHGDEANDNQLFCEYASDQLNIKRREILTLQAVRASLDARKGRDIVFVYTFKLELSKELERALVKKYAGRVELAQNERQYELVHGTERLNNRIVVVGLGPAGLFAAYELAKHGYRPIVIERGKPIDERTEKVNSYWKGHELDPECNVMFGEGGAGSFSDGKLTTRIKDARAAYVVRLLAEHGAPRDITINAKPHIGTDELKKVVKAMRKTIVGLGGEICFSTRLSGLEIDAGKLCAIKVCANGVEQIWPCDNCILAMGQGAYDTYDMLLESAVSMTAKPYAMGVRIEHPREVIDKSQYGAQFSHPRLGAAEYRLTARAGDRGVYTFCMCPGGYVVASASASDEVVVNGMSCHARDAANSNSAVVVQVDERDFGNNAKDALQFRKKYERAAYELGEGLGPCQLTGDYLIGKASKSLGGVKPTYKPGVLLTDITRCLPDIVAGGIREGMCDFGRKLKGFDMHDSVITAIESRTSAPVRILRAQDGQSLSVKGLYPVGEGAGYAGGIVSAAVDGLKAAEQIISRFKEE